MSDETEKTLREIYSRYRTDLESYAWEWEDDRWDELVFCLLWRLGNTSAEVARRAVGVLKSLRLLEVSDLAAMSGQVDDASVAGTDARLFRLVLERSGLDAQAAMRTHTAVIDAARGVAARYDGRIQLYLRSYGHRMLASLHEDFPFLDMDDKQIRFAVAVWLQNVLSLPVPAWDDAAQDFCRRLGISESELVESADRLNMNVAVLDDLISRFIEDANGEDQGRMEGPTDE